ncbi:hypothetical protein BB560_001422, partial [Smittium megazygosporum]
PISLTKSPSHVAVVLPSKYENILSLESSKFPVSTEKYLPLKIEMFFGIRNLVLWSILYKISTLSLYTNSEVLKDNVLGIIEQLRAMLVSSKHILERYGISRNLKILIISDDSQFFILPDSYSNTPKTNVEPDFTIHLLSRLDGSPKIASVSLSLAKEYSRSELENLRADFDIFTYMSKKSYNSHPSSPSSFCLLDPQLVVLFNKTMSFNNFPCLLLKSSEVS